MSKTLLITRPNHDTETNFLHAFCIKVIGIADKKGFTIYDLEGAKAKKKMFDSYIKKRKPAFIFLNGHGNAEEIAAHDNETLVNTTSKLEASILYARSCESGKKLGRELLQNGMAAFIGYTRKFVFVYLKKNVTKPGQDALAKLFLKPSNLVATTLIKGHSVKEAHKRSKSVMYKNLRKMLSSTASYEEQYAAKSLWSNYKSQVLYGDENATVY